MNIHNYDSFGMFQQAKQIMVESGASDEISFVDLPVRVEK